MDPSAQFAQAITEVRHIEAKSVVAPRRAAVARGYWLAKRSFDLLLATLLMILLAPVGALIALLIRLDSKGPVIFVQKRVRGLTADEKPILFSFYKFRSMYTGADPEVHRRYTRDLINGNGKTHAQLRNGRQRRPLYKLADDPRVTHFGRFLRRTSLDELPQLWNVFVGDMSLVGPRPALPYEVAEYQPWHRQRLEATPGITGLWQVSGRSALSFDDMLRLDLEYASRRSFWCDLALLLRTIPVVLLGVGAG